MNVDAWPGRSRSATDRTTSFALRTGRPSTATSTSPPYVKATPLKSRSSVPPRRPARRAGAARPHRGDHRAVAHRVAEAPGDARGEVLAGDPDVGIRRPCPFASSCAIERRAALIGTAKPTPSALPLSLRICALIPITRPWASKSGPPELPWLIGASTWIASTRLYCEVSDSIERCGRGDDADRERVLVPERAADRRHRLADDDAARVAERKRRQRRAPSGRPGSRRRRRRRPSRRSAPRPGRGPGTRRRRCSPAGRRRRAVARGRDHVRVGQDHAVARRRRSPSPAPRVVLRPEPKTE